MSSSNPIFSSPPSHDQSIEEISKRRAENVKALEAKQQQQELESYRRSEAIEASRREQLRKQRHNEQLLIEAAEAAEREEQEKAKAEREERERKRLAELEEQKRRIEKAKEEEKARLAAREKQIKEQREAAAKAKAEEERRRQQYLEETASERMKKSYDRLLDKLSTTISADRQMMEEDTAKRRYERQLASDAATALGRVKGIETTLQKHREKGREKLHHKIEKEQTEDLDERFHITFTEKHRHVHDYSYGSCYSAEGEEEREAILNHREEELEKDRKELKSILVIESQNHHLLQKEENNEQQQQEDGDGAEKQNASQQDQQTTNYFGTSVTSPGSTRRKRELKPLDFETWQKQREAESELVSLSLEYQMRTS